ncbi:MAG: cytochrome c family protein, partial [gamma proteobacterium symbiont of Ctena orbiculata]
MEAVSASRIFHTLSLLFTSLILFVQPATTLAAADEPLHQVSSEVCKNCHKEIYKQWQGSMHAQSTALKDPIHATFYKKV